MSEVPNSTGHRLKAYKNKALDSQELRRRREEEGIQLRKLKREEQVNSDFFLFSTILCTMTTGGPFQSVPKLMIIDESLNEISRTSKSL